MIILTYGSENILTKRQPIRSANGGLHEGLQHVRRPANGGADNSLADNSSAENSSKDNSPRATPGRTTTTEGQLNRGTTRLRTTRPQTTRPVDDSPADDMPVDDTPADDPSALHTIRFPVRRPRNKEFCILLSSDGWQCVRSEGD